MVLKHREDRESQLLTEGSPRNPKLADPADVERVGLLNYGNVRIQKMEGESAAGD